MKNFAQLIKTIDSTNKTNLKVAALTEYFQTAADNDKLWAIAILSHRRPKRPVNTTLLRQWATEISDIPLWLFEESYHIVGDLAETIALILPAINRWQLIFLKYKRYGRFLKQKKRNIYTPTG